MNIDVLNLIYSSGLNYFLYTKDNLVKRYGKVKNSYMIQLNLYINEISYIKENFEKFKEISEKILFTFNQSGSYYFKNITFNKVKIGNDIYNNSFFLYNSKSDINGFINSDTIIEFEKKNIDKIQTNNDIYDKIYELAENKNLSVRKLMKLGLNQTKARNIYKKMKDEGIIIFYNGNNNDKRYDLEKLQYYIKIAKNKRGV